MTQACTAKPAPPALFGPADGSIVSRSQLFRFDWIASGGAVDYYAEATSGGGLVLNSGWTTNISWPLSITHGGAYTWHVKARNAAGESGWRASRLLYARPAPPTNVSAPTGSTIQIGPSLNS